MLVLGNNMVNDEWMAEFSCQWSNLTSLTIYCDFTCTIGDRVSCPRLTSLNTTGSDFISWNGDNLSNLTFLQLTSEDDDSYPHEVLEVISLHCHHLKTFVYPFGPSPETNLLLLEIVKQNHELNSVQFEVDKILLCELSLVSFSNLTSINLSGSFAFDPIVSMLQNFPRVDSLYCSDFYDSLGALSIHCIKSQKSLMLNGPCDKVAGWKSFVPLMLGLRELLLFGEYVNRLTFSDVLFDSLRKVKILCATLDQRVLKTLLKRCTGLTTFYCKCSNAIDWSEVMSESNVIEDLTLGRAYDLVALLST